MELSGGFVPLAQSGEGFFTGAESGTIFKGEFKAGLRLRLLSETQEMACNALHPCSLSTRPLRTLLCTHPGVPNAVKVVVVLVLAYDLLYQPSIDRPPADEA